MHDNLPERDMYRTKWRLPVMRDILYYADFLSWNSCPVLGLNETPVVYLWVVKEA